MAIIDELLNASYQDTQLLVGNDEKGDNFNISREVDFVLYAPSHEKADVVTSFINDNQYGSASFNEVDGRYRIIVILNMPITQNLICSVSGLMTCLAELFSIEYDGWGCIIQNT